MDHNEITFSLPTIKTTIYSNMWNNFQVITNVKYDLEIQNYKKMCKNRN